MIVKLYVIQFFFLFKQKTAYEMRTSDWSSDVCSSDLLDLLLYTDIGMNAFSYFLAFARLAPVQCVTWGHPDTTGIPALDYFISNDLAEPEDAESHYSERLVRLDGVQDRKSTRLNSSH